MTRQQEFRKQTEEAKLKAFSLMCKKVADLEKENAELKHNKKTVAHLADCLEEKMKERIEELETRCTELFLQNNEFAERFEKSIEIIKGLLSCCRNYPQENAELEQTNNNLLDVINNQDVKIADLEKQIEEYKNGNFVQTVNQIIEGKDKQIEKMKCCQNCDHYRWSNGDDWCNDHYGQPMYDEECKEKWELRR